jgi:hypothetical protein
LPCFMKLSRVLHGSRLAPLDSHMQSLVDLRLATKFLDHFNSFVWFIVLLDGLNFRRHLISWSLMSLSGLNFSH